MGIFVYIFLIIIAENTADAYLENNVTKAFICNDIVPDYVPKAPKCRVKIEYPCDINVDLGNKLTPNNTKDIPKVYYEANEYKYYTLVMTDRKVSSRRNYTLGQVRHWIVVNIPGNEVDDGETIAEYIGPGPSNCTGYHCYVFLVYEQPDKRCFYERKLDNKSEKGRLKFNVSEFAKKYDLGNPIAGNFFFAKFDKYVAEREEKFSKNSK